LVADPGDERQARPIARRHADSRDHVGHVRTVRERAPHYAIDRGVVGELLGLDDEVAHNPHARSHLAAYAIGLSTPDGADPHIEGGFNGPIRKINIGTRTSAVSFTCPRHERMTPRTNL
jgi:hypothetical protein